MKENLVIATLMRNVERRFEVRHFLFLPGEMEVATHVCSSQVHFIVRISCMEILSELPYADRFREERQKPILRIGHDRAMFY